MTRPERRRRSATLGFGVDRATAAYVGLFLLVAAVGWTSVMLLVPATGASTPTTAASRSAVAAVATASHIAVVTPAPSPTDTPAPATPSPVPAPTKAPYKIDLYQANTFVSQMNREYCMAGAAQNMLNILKPTANLTSAYQEQVGNTLVSLTTAEDSYNGGFGPDGWALTLTAYGAGPYKLIIDTTFDQAMKDAALALESTSRPVGLLTWWGAHSWVMTGFQADSDPLLFPTTFRLGGAYIVDPFYPRVSDIWGQTLGPDIFRNMTVMAHNYIGWKRPEGYYPERDGKWLLVIPYDEYPQPAWSHMTA